MRQAGLRTLQTQRGELLDEAVVIQYQAPRSQTGEDTVEIICHGGWVTPTRITQSLVELGARPAEPGEFTRRAVLNGKLDLLQAEAVNDLIRADSSAGATLALRQLDGGLSRRIVSLREEILETEALTAYEIDFPEEDDGPIAAHRVQDAAAKLVATIDQLLATAPAGELIRQGATVAIVGPPNVGKSSLFNALLGRKRAIVTDVPGTTRDALEAVLDTMPIPLRLVDTAGLRETTDVVERLGVEVSREYLTTAQVVLACGDSDDALAHATQAAKEFAGGRVVPVRTKADLETPRGAASSGEALQVSATTGEGLDRLLAYVATVVATHVEMPAPESPIVTHARYQNVLIRARGELVAFQTSRLDVTIPATVSVIHLRESVRILEELIGAVDIEDILGKVFSAFCVGK